MRSVVVVLPASMCALMPMLRYRSMGVTRGTWRLRRGGVRGGSPFRAGAFAVLSSCWVSLCGDSEPEMRERLVGFGHPVHFLALLDRAAAAFRGLEELGREPRAHR